MSAALGACAPACGAGDEEGAPSRPEHGFVTEWCIDVEPSVVGDIPRTEPAICARGERECSSDRPCQRHSG